jgi:hypothetical protein
MGQTFVRYWDAKYGYDYNWYKWAERNSVEIYSDESEEENQIIEEILNS